MNDTVNVPRKTIDFLLGIGELDGHWFGEPRMGGQYWWREHLSKALLAADQPAVDEVEVVAFLMRPDFYEPYVSMSMDRCDGTTEPLMTVRQHEAILASALAAK